MRIEQPLSNAVETKLSPDTVGFAVAPDRTLDIRGEICPLTFVLTRLALDRLAPDQTLLVIMAGAEPIHNVPRTAVEQGHSVVAMEESPEGVARLLIRKK